MKTYHFPLDIKRTPQEVFSIFQNQEGSLFLDSSNDEGLSYICFDPDKIYKWKASNANDTPFEDLQNLLDLHQPKTTFSSNIFTGGLAGYISYDIRYVSDINYGLKEDLSTPDIYMGVYTQVLAYAHEDKSWSYFTTCSSETVALKNKNKLFERLEKNTDTTQKKISKLSFSPRISKAQYLKNVEKIIEYIYAGDIFQACYAQSFSADISPDFSSYNHYRHLREISPAPFSAYMNCGEAVISSNSPERFLKVDKRHVETKPIKGTAPRFSDKDRDKHSATNLLTSEKDRAENAMIVDLLRNDLSKVCECHSVEVPSFCKLESFANVHHLVSTVTGELKDGKTAIDLLKATMPGGSISGAPKIRAMEIIDEMEDLRRGPYCGAMGYIGFNGNMDMNILIRTIIYTKEHATFFSGGAITSDSNPEAEYQETLDKASKLMESFSS